MDNAPAPSRIFERAAREGRRRVDQSFHELAATSFIAGFTIVIGLVALAITQDAATPAAGGMARLYGAGAFGIGLVLLIVQRAELFSENFFDPVAAVFMDRRSVRYSRVARLWVLTLAFNLVGAALMAWLVATEGVLPLGAQDVLRDTAAELARRSALACFVSAIVGGALVALLSFALAGADSVLARIALAFAVGFLLALGPFDHVVVTGIHLFMGILAGAPIATMEVLQVTLLATLGNLLGGVGLVTFSHAAQARR